MSSAQCVGNQGTQVEPAQAAGLLRPGGAAPRGEVGTHVCRGVQSVGRDVRTDPAAGRCEARAAARDPPGMAKKVEAFLAIC